MKRKILSILLLITITTTMLTASPMHVALAADTDFVLDGNNIKTGNVNGLTFKGFGVLSGNSTSALLMDYKAEQPEKYAELLQILFGGKNPIMTHVKIEMGNDRNNSTGPDPATMRWENEAANVKRHPGFQLAADAKKVNLILKSAYYAGMPLVGQIPMIRFIHGIRTLYWLHIVNMVIWLIT